VINRKDGRSASDLIAEYLLWALGQRRVVLSGGYSSSDCLTNQMTHHPVGGVADHSLFKEQSHHPLGRRDASRRLGLGVYRV
jgi:hypothetical protein